MDKISTMDDCARYLKSLGICAEIGIDYIFLKFEGSTFVSLTDKEIDFDFLSDLKDKINCSFTISMMIPDPSDKSFPWWTRKKIINDKGILLILNRRRFGDSGGPVFTEDF